jgi:hypothetical protein
MDRILWVSMMIFQVTVLLTVLYGEAVSLPYFLQTVV